MKLKYTLMIAIAAVLPAAALLGEEEHGAIKGDNSKMMEMHQKMEADMKAQDAELDKLVAAMSSATGDKKADAVAAVVAKFVEQRKGMHSKMSGMGGDMMSAMECCKGGKGMMGHDMMSKPVTSPTPSGH